jgi:hypothetical protein
MNNQVWRGLAYGLLLAIAPCSAITIQNQNVDAGTFYSVLSPTFNGIGSINGNFCTGFAISSTRVLTAAHCVPDPNGVSFSLPLIDGTIYNPSQVRIHPLFNGNLGTGNDIAVLEFGANVLPGSMNVYPIYEVNNLNDIFGLDFQLFGYGQCGTGAGNSGCPVGSPLHRAANRVDSFLIANNDFAGVYLYDFVDYTQGNSTVPGRENCPASSPLCIVTGNVLPSKQTDPDIGDRQGMISFGDSGGPSLVFVNGEWRALGIHSFISCLGFTQQNQNCTSPPDANGGFPNSSFGEFGGDTLISFHANFVNNVPEPATWLVMTAGLVVIARLRRQR